LHKSQIDCKKLHKSSDETDRDRNGSLLQMRDSDCDSTPVDSSSVMTLLHSAHRTAVQKQCAKRETVS